MPTRTPSSYKDSSHHKRRMPEIHKPWIHHVYVATRQSQSTAKAFPAALLDSPFKGSSTGSQKQRSVTPFMAWAIIYNTDWWSPWFILPSSLDIRSSLFITSEDPPSIASNNPFMRSSVLSSAAARYISSKTSLMARHAASVPKLAVFYQVSFPHICRSGHVSPASIIAKWDISF